MEDQPISPDDQEIESALQTLALAPIRATPRQVWYQAGVEVGRRRATPWRAATATLAVAALSLLLWNPLAGRPAERVVYVPQPNPTPHASHPSPPPSTALATNLKLRDTLIESGWDALPPASTHAPPQPPLRAAPPQF